MAHPWNGSRSRPNVKEQIIKKKRKNGFLLLNNGRPTLVLANKGIYGRTTGGYGKKEEQDKQQERIRVTFD